MIDEKRKQEAKRNFAQYLRDGLIRKEHHEAAEHKYLENAELSLKVANEIAEPNQGLFVGDRDFVLCHVLCGQRSSPPSRIQNRRENRPQSHQRRLDRPCSR